MSSKYTSVPDVIDTLLATFTVALDAFDPNVAIFDGYPAAGAQPDDYVVVGGTTANTAEGSSKPSGFPVKVRIEEDYVVRGVVSSFRGGTDTAVVRDRAHAILDVILDSIYADVTLAGACAWCLFDRHVFKDSDYLTASQGRFGSIEFTLHVYAFRNILPTS